MADHFGIGPGTTIMPRQKIPGRGQHGEAKYFQHETIQSNVFRTKELYYPEYKVSNQAAIRQHDQVIHHPYTSQSYHTFNETTHTNPNDRRPPSAFKPIESSEQRNPELLPRYDHSPSMGQHNTGSDFYQGSFTSERNERSNRDRYATTTPSVQPVVPTTLSIPWQNSRYHEYHHPFGMWHEYSKAPYSQPTPQVADYTTDVQPVDVLCGRGGATNSHSGNAGFRFIVERYKLEYLTAKKCDKPAVAGRIVEIIRKKGGRFLRKYTLPNSLDPITDDDGNVIWYDIGDEKAKEKTCQALREGAPEIRRKTDDRKEDSSNSEEYAKNESNGTRGKVIGTNISTNFQRVCSPSVATRSDSTTSDTSRKATTPDSSHTFFTSESLWNSKDSSYDSQQYEEWPPRKIQRVSEMGQRHKNVLTRHRLRDALDPLEFLSGSKTETGLSFSPTNQVDELLQSFEPPNSNIRQKEAIHRDIASVSSADQFF